MKRASCGDDAVPLSVLGEQLGRPPGVQHTGVGLEEHPVEVVDRKRGKEIAGVVRREPLVGDPEALEHGDALGLEPVAAPGEPGQPDAFPDPRARRTFEVEPEDSCARGARRVPLGCAVRGAQQTRVSSRRRAGRPRRVLLGERHVPATQRQLACESCAEDARADDACRAHVFGVTLSESTSGRW